MLGGAARPEISKRAPSAAHADLTGCIGAGGAARPDVSNREP